MTEWDPTWMLISLLPLDGTPIPHILSNLLSEMTAPDVNEFH